MKWYERWRIKGGSIYYLWGYPYKLKTDNEKCNEIKIKDNYLYFPTFHKDPERKIKLENWYDNILEKEIEIIKDKIEKIVGEKANNYYIDAFRRRGGLSYWGTCERENKVITINRKAVFFRKEILEYLMIHELLHLRIKDHNDEFYKEVEKYCPNHSIIHLCYAFSNPDYRYFDYLLHKKNNNFDYDFEEYCNIYKIKKDIL